MRACMIYKRMCMFICVVCTSLHIQTLYKYTYNIYMCSILFKIYILINKIHADTLESYL